MPADGKQNSRRKQLKRKYVPRSKQRRLGGGGLPDVVNPRTRRLEYGRILKPDRKS